MVGEDKIFDHLGESVLFGQVHALGDVRNDDFGRFLFRELVVGIDAALVFGEVAGVDELADVVVEGAGAHQLHLGSDFGRDLCREVAHLNGVDESALGFFGQAADDGQIGVVEFDERHARSEAKGLLNEIEQGVGEEQRHARDGHVAIPRAVDGGETPGLGEFEHQTGHPGAERHDERGEKDLRTLGEILDAVDTHHAGHELREEKLVAVVEWQRGHEDRHHMGHESGARVGENAQHNGQHGEGNDVDGEEFVGEK